MIETERYCQYISEIQKLHLENDHEDISCYEAIAIWLSEWVGDQVLYQLDQKMDKRRGN